jgi:hypothetical protein
MFSFRMTSTLNSVAADFSITHPKLPNRIKDAPERQKGDYAPDHALLTKQPEKSFRPGLEKIRAWLSTIELK